jgi:hypothetical protein
MSTTCSISVEENEETGKVDKTLMGKGGGGGGRIRSTSVKIVFWLDNEDADIAFQIFFPSHK